MSLEGRVAAITGASAGIGLACAEHFARAGMPVVLGARREDKLAEVVDRIASTGGRATALACDVANEADVTRLVAHAMASFGRLDVMMCNAGFGYYGTVEDTPPGVMRRMMDVNFLGTYLGARAALPIFRGIAFMSGYSATKAAQAGFAESLRSEFAGTGIHVSCVFPISTETEFREAMARDYGHAVSGLGPKQSVEDVARAVVACLRSPRPEVYPHPTSRALVILNAIAPAFTDRLVKKYGRRRDVTIAPR
ncbi:MAG: hypothetical protein DMF86_06770 [Acidobacteria bacterium]|nr:MAG: hypothetical protein DMF86_06770 [Acidobacteriota bacterium]